MECPRCRAEAGAALECPRCGVVLAKARAPRRRPEAAGGADRELGVKDAGRLRPLAPVALLLVVAVSAFAAWRLTRPHVPPAEQAPAPNEDAGGGDADVVGQETPELPPPARHEVTIPLPPPPSLGGAAPAEDVQLAAALAVKLRSGQAIGADDVRAAEQLFSRHGEAAAGLLAAVSVAAARRQQAEQHPEEALRLLERAAAVQPRLEAPWRGLLAVRADQGDWPGTEAAAREVLRLRPGDGEAVQTLAYALLRQDRSGEATTLLAAHLKQHEDPLAAALLARIRRADSTEGGLRQQTLSHFSVRYDGEAHEDVGREVLGVLERHYAALATTFDHQPRSSIPVVLLSREAYYSGDDVPVWSGGRYDNFDGRVRVPIGGLTTALTPRLDSIVLHELAHAFVADRSAGLAPRELHEGVAQWMEGRRSNDEALAALVQGRLPPVPAFYLGSLAFVEDLIRERGQGGINDVLAAMARTRDVEAAFREVYGRDFHAAVAASKVRWSQRLGS